MWSQITTLLGVLLIDITLAVDNAVVMGTVAAKLPHAVRRKAIVIGVVAAAFFRIIFAAFALRLLSVFGLTLAGGLLLLWVAWKLWRDLHLSGIELGPQAHGASSHKGLTPHTSLNQAIVQILIADVSMSLDNTLAVAGTARDHFGIMVFGLALSVLFMGVAANLLANLLHRYRWISYLGLFIVVYVALSMIWEGAHAIVASL